MNSPLSLPILDYVPEDFVQASPKAIMDMFPGPTLLDLPGRTSPPLFVSTLLHGNEASGLLAVQEILRRFRESGLPRRLIVFIGNPEAARAGVRTLDCQHDFNRSWPGTHHPETREAKLIRQVYNYVARQHPVASIDIHNTTGRNPKFAVVDRLDPPFLNLAARFSSRVILFDKTNGLQQQAMARICPAVTVECGQTGTPGCERHAIKLIEACLLDNDPANLTLTDKPLTILKAFVAITVPGSVSFSLDGSPADICFRKDIDLLNFRIIKAGTVIAEISGEPGTCLQQEALTELAPPDFFDFTRGKLTLTRPAIPTMLTQDKRAVELDCLCHFMQRIDQQGRVLPMGNLDATQDPD